MNADDVILKELKFSNHYTLKQQAFLHTMTTNNNLSGVRGMCEFTIGDTLYILSSVYRKDYREFKQNIPDVPTLVDKLMSIYPQEGDNSSYLIQIFTLTPATLTLTSDLDTIQYTLTPTPDLAAGSICDTIFKSSNFKCGILIKEVFDELSSYRLHYNFSEYDNIVIIPIDFDSLSYQQYGYVILSDICFFLKISDGFVTKIEIRDFNYSGQRFIDDLSYY